MSSTAFVQFVVDQLDRLRRLEARAMFGGHGLYLDGVFFAIVFKGKLYLRVGPATVGAYEARGMGPFRPGERQTSKRYYEVPADVLEDPVELQRWARAAAGAAREAESAGAAGRTADDRSPRGRRAGGKKVRKRCP